MSMVLGGAKCLASRLGSVTVLEWGDIVGMLWLAVVNVKRYTIAGRGPKVFNVCFSLRFGVFIGTENKSRDVPAAGACAL